jgi:carboxymethylenebutenolidase
MANDPVRQLKRDVQSGKMTRRDFVAFSVTAGVAVTAGCAAEDTAQEIEVVEEDVEITTPDGTADAAYIHPRTGAYAGVLIWTDAFGLRPSFRAMARRLAADGYSVLVPNPFYRVERAPSFPDASVVSFGDPDTRARLGPLMGSITAADAAERDASAYIPFLDAQANVDTSKKIGTQGYCMGGPLIVRTAASQSDRIGAAASFHGGGLVTANENSPHLLAPNIQARMYFGIAANDDANQPEAKDVLRETFADAGLQAEIEVYSEAQHGWCVTDMPAQGGTPVYDEVDAERAWGKLTELYAAALV